MTAREWKPGDVAIRTGKDGVEVLTMVAASNPSALGSCLCTPGMAKGVPHWHHANGRWNPIPDDREHGTYRPLVVIDPEDRDQVERLSRALTAAAGWTEACQEQRTAALNDALRSLIALPKPEEPTGLGAVVEAINDNQFVRVATGERPWQRVSDVEGEYLCEWRDIAAVRVLSEGVPA